MCHIACYDPLYRGNRQQGTGNREQGPGNREKQPAASGKGHETEPNGTKRNQMEQNGTKRNEMEPNGTGGNRTERLFVDFREHFAGLFCRNVNPSNSFLACAWPGTESFRKDFPARPRTPCEPVRRPGRCAEPSPSAKNLHTLPSCWTLAMTALLVACEGGRPPAGTTGRSAWPLYLLAVTRFPYRKQGIWRGYFRRKLLATNEKRNSYFLGLILFGWLFSGRETVMWRGQLYLRPPVINRSGSKQNTLIS